MKPCLVCSRPLDGVPHGKRGPKPTMHPDCAELRAVARWAFLRAAKLGANWARLVAP
jgi:hypothetical protein